MNTGLYIVTATSMEIVFTRAFMVSWRFCDTDNESQHTKRAFTLNFPNCPATRPRAKFFEPRQIWYQNAPIRETKGPGKRGHIVADTLLPMFLRLRKLGNICCGHKMFLNKIRNIFVSRTQNLCPQQMLHVWANRATFVSATMCPRLPEPLVSLIVRKSLEFFCT